MENEQVEVNDESERELINFSYLHNATELVVVPAVGT